MPTLTQWPDMKARQWDGSERPTAWQYAKVQSWAEWIWIFKSKTPSTPEQVKPVEQAIYGYNGGGGTKDTSVNEGEEE